MGIGFDAWNRTDYSAIPIVDQFPDYDWAASFDLANDWPASGLAAQMPPDNVGYGPMNFG